MRRLPGIFEVKASYREGKAVVRYDPALVSPAEMGEAIEAATYYTVGEPVTDGELPGGEEVVAGATAVIRVEGMTDERAASLVTQAMGAVGPGVLDVSLDVARSTLTVTYDDEQVSPEALVEAVKRGSGLESSLVSSTFAQAEADGGTDYTPYVLIGIAGLFAAALAWYGFSSGRRRLARAAPSRATRRRGRRGR